MVLRSGLPTLRRFLALIGLCALAGCSSAPPPVQRLAHHRGQVDPRYGVAPSPRVVADGEPVPRGGGSYMVGKPYQIAGKTYFPSERPYSSIGLASWYGSDFHGRRTANGEVFDLESISAAHPTMPLPSYARVTNLRNHRSMIVRVNDRGPYHGGRVMDVSQRVAEALDFHRVGTARVKVDYVGRAALEGSDDEKLLATLRDDAPAMLPGVSPILVASRPEPVRTAMLEAPPPRMERASASRRDEPEEAVAAASVPVSAKALAMARSAPLPPSRPFDLGASSHGRTKQAAN
ncbi:septal ring lytic transglycosylase RlpA family protein [Methylosinus sp. Sm6]|uniref:septal ring lytic transglycosylase RlpA family protein n=1 Tax=Methylosinus sp. Sm6 TaxID=2866948 RepID=UPI001C99BA8D|nr:septal ring lytic transglycosylase RlpA family protein [Methylosinus sp. Sm6]MBY6243712.1 septal ring lytic transglycosylase RlpA family protein [Methylosinus sp. Sm6]